MSWRFYPLAEDISCGVLERVGYRGPALLRVAEFLTPEEARAAAQAKDAQRRRG